MPHRRYSVAILGFDAPQEEKLTTILQSNQQNTKSYTIISNTNVHADILLVNFDNVAAINKQAALLAINPSAKTVAFSRGPLSNPPAYHIRGIVTASRLLGIIDTIKHPIDDAPIAEKPTQPTSHLSIVPNAPAQETAYPTEQPEKIDLISIGYKALVVDDSLAIQKSIEVKLVELEQISGIDFAASGEEALEKATQDHYDLIFLDVMMPGIDGYETCTQLRKIAAYKRTPIIMVSGKTSPLDEVKGVMAGCTTYLTKPVKDDAFSKLSQRVLTWLDNQKESKNL